MTAQVGPQTIAVYSASANEYTLPVTITERTGADISGDQFTLYLGDEIGPGGAGSSPDVFTVNIITMSQYMASGGYNARNVPLDTKLTQVVVEVLIGQTGSINPPVGSYWLWVRVGDNSESVPRRAHKVIIT